MLIILVFVNWCEPKTLFTVYTVQITDLLAPAMNSYTKSGIYELKHSGGYIILPQNTLIFSYQVIPLFQLIPKLFSNGQQSKHNFTVVLFGCNNDKLILYTFAMKWRKH